MKKFLLIGLLVPLLTLNVMAQRQISGKIVDEDEKSPLPGVNIIVKGTSIGTTSDVNGAYSLEVPDENSELIFSFIGYQTLEVNVGNRSVVDVSLAQDITQLGEVVVTALGIEKEERGLTYSTQQIDGDELTTVKDQNMINTLAGKTAGINIVKTAGGVGASSRVLLRGNKSINGQNQPLYVIDGIPMNNANLGSTSDLFGTVDNGDAIANLNPEDIESINVLKGASAAALYGSQAANGVILITTKKGKRGVSEISFSSSLTFEKPLLTPELQSKYGQTDPGVSISTWGNTGAGASSDHVDEFFNTGSTFINSISLTHGNEAGQFYASYARTDAKGIVPENSMEKNNFTLRATTKLFENVSLDASASMINQRIRNTPLPGFYHNPVLSTYMFPETLEDFKGYKRNFEVFDDVRNLTVQNYPYKDLNNIFVTDNPYWIVNRQENDSWRNRGIYKLSATVPVSEHLDVIGRINYDRTEDEFEHRLFATSSAINVNPYGDYQTRSQMASQLYTDILLNYDNSLGENTSLTATVGFSNMYNNTESVNLQSTANNDVGLRVPNYFAIQNFQANFIAQETETESLLQAAFGTATVGFSNTFFVDFTARNEWSSTLQPDNNSFFYPSGGLTFILSEVLGTGNLFSYGKIRASYSIVGNALPPGVAFPQPRTISNTGNISAPVSAPLDVLDPERVKSFEVGTNLRFFDHGLNLDLTYYNNKVEDQFFTIPGKVGDAYLNYFINGGTVKNSGIEAVISYKFPASGNLSYSTSLNFATNNNEVLEIDDRLEERFTVTTFAAARIAEIRVQEGGSYGDLYGIALERDANGNIVVHEEVVDGEVQRTIGKTATEDLVYLGNPNPDWQLGWQNTFEYKGFSLKLLLDGKFGGEVLSQTEAILDAYGRSQRTADARDAGEVSTGGQTFDPQFYYTSIGGIQGVGAEYIYDATNIRLREVAMSYTIPSGVFGNTLKRLTLSAIGRNLFFIKNDAPFDPEVSAGSGNALQGIHTFLVPSTRSFGFSVNATF